MDYLLIVLVTFISGVLGTGLGGFIGAVLRRNSNKIISVLLSFAGGVMLAVVCFDRMEQPLEMMKAGLLPSYTPIILVSAVVVGYCAVYFLNKVIDSRADRLR
ncbi:MAG: ZIP family metal transporter, partial [Clostridia bacterium]|nr:ZIP family metal transporter [Clostridia bacterium]